MARSSRQKAAVRAVAKAAAPAKAVRATAVDETALAVVARELVDAWRSTTAVHAHVEAIDALILDKPRDGALTPLREACAALGATWRRTTAIHANVEELAALLA